MKFKTKFTEEDTEDFKKWFSFYPQWSWCGFYINKWNYFDPRPEVVTNVTTLIMIACLLLSPFVSWWLLLSLIFIIRGWGKLFIQLPFDTGMTDESDYPSYGFNFYHPCSDEKAFFTEFWIRTGKKINMINMPWSLEWYRTSILIDKNKYAALKQDDKKGMYHHTAWVHSVKGNSLDFYTQQWKDTFQKCWEYDFTDPTDGEVIPAKIYVEEREWRRKGLYKLPWFNLVRRSIDIEFSKEVGSRKGSWKGGTLGTSYTLKKGETPIECIKRIETENKF